jgi:dipeptide/tripeptide permease
MVHGALYVVYGAELFERFAYYGSVFLVPTYVTVVMGASQNVSNLLINLIFAVSPLSSLLAFRPADTWLGKPRTMAIGLCLYTCGLALLVTSSLPSFYGTYPGQPDGVAWVFFVLGVVLLSVGYGGFKTVSAPLVADALDASKEPAAKRAKFYLFYAWIINVGALAGTLVSPFLRQLSSDKAPDPQDRTQTVSTAYYISFSVCAVAAACGFLLSLAMMRSLRTVCSSTGRMAGAWCWSDLSSALRDPRSTQRRTLQTCKIFAVLPFFWLIQNQFMSNIMFQVQWMDLPPSLPEEFFNNVNTVTMLLSIIVLQFAFQRRGVVPSQRSRMLAGFAIVGASMTYCAAVQLGIQDRGYFSDSGGYVLLHNQQQLSAWLMVPPFVASGISSALIDPTTLEAAFQRSAPAHKSLVMSLYLVAASASGFLGMAVSPLAAPRTLVVLYGAMTAVLAASCFWWRQLEIVDLDCCTTVSNR